jgi:Zn-dependent peptidase ImmA (M78 family)
MMHEFKNAERIADQLRCELIGGSMSTAKVLPAFRRFISERGWALSVVQYEDWDSNMEAWTDPQKKVVYVRSDVLEAARLGKGRECFTLTEEMFHVVYEHKHVRHRKNEYSASERAHDEISGDERQAKMSAAAFLMPNDEIRGGAAAQDVANQFGVSLSAADIRLADLARFAGFAREKREIPPSIADFVAEMRRRAEESRYHR